MNFHNNSFFVFLLVVLALFGVTEANCDRDHACIVGNGGCWAINPSYSCHDDPTASAYRACGLFSLFKLIADLGQTQSLWTWFNRNSNAIVAPNIAYIFSYGLTIASIDKCSCDTQNINVRYLYTVTVGNEGGTTNDRFGSRWNNSLMVGRTWSNAFHLGNKSREQL
ncbi:uncharacterized protein BX664DRAFT_388804 [Halteromyces radiatus]|uniref:uncharacterized protein n=1 Tax=Halteromyces radiatus TaxID=101107 RepID=UPI00221E7044|nr:uncharacterized protein BX664DRAFT_388804 [Halteromyces radiatus]KAI8079824.1 hypothetical protein BX664DRAFT_388804 [Halteromyces radiatus]